jgi:DNA-binding NtrC family response regulator
MAELSLPDSSGIDLLQRLRRARPDLPIVLTTAFGSVEDAVQAMRSGAADFLGKPFAPEQVLVAVDRALEKATLVRENQDLRHALDDRLRLENLIGTDSRMQGIFKTVRAVADTRTTVLVTGESGTGKTLLARAIHNLSARRNGPFVEVNCGALPESLLESELFGHVKGAFTGALRDRAGKFESAAHGTIFLDEIGTSSPAFQVRLLRVLQDRVIERVGDTQTIPVDVRVLIATNLDLEQAVREGRFREDLYYRINVVPVEMPPLRARPGDVPFLADHFLRRFRQEHGKDVLGFTPVAMAILTRAPWPGNVRQLENVVERAVVLCQGNRIDAGDLPPGLSGGTGATAAGLAPAALLGDGPVLPLKEALLAPERAAIVRALEQCGGNREAAAKVLDINRSTLFAKLRKHGIK